MANLCGKPIQIVASGGAPIVNVYGVLVQGQQIGAPVFTPTAHTGMVASIVAERGAPAILVNDDGSEWTP